MTNEPLQIALNTFPNFFMFDREVLNDSTFSLSANGIAAWKSYLGNGNPQSFPSVNYFYHDYADSSFFYLDTFTFAEPFVTMIGSLQKFRLFNWLLEKNSSTVFKFLLSPSPWTSNLPDYIRPWGSKFYSSERDGKSFQLQTF